MAPPEIELHAKVALWIQNTVNTCKKIIFSLQWPNGHSGTSFSSLYLVILVLFLSLSTNPIEQVSGWMLLIRRMVALVASISFRHSSVFCGTQKA